MFETAVLALETAIAEVSHHLGGTVPLQHRIAVLFEVSNLNMVVDLTDEATLRQYGVERADLILDSYEKTQRLAHQLRSAGVQALIVGSARHPGGVNIVLFLENIPQSAIRELERAPI